MQYVEPEAAIHQGGLRLAVTQGVPAPWSESAKAVFRIKRVSFTPVAQKGGEDNLDLVAWTKHRNAPIAMYEDEAPRVRWLEIVELAERLGTGPALLPERREERMSVVGLTNEIAGESGFAWHGRVLMLSMMEELQGTAARSSNMYKDYSHGIGDTRGSLESVRSFLDYLADKISAQRNLGSPYLVGTALTAADIYWAYFSQLLHPLPTDLCATPDQVLAFWASVPNAVGNFEASLVEHRDYIFKHYLELPVEF